MGERKQEPSSLIRAKDQQPDFERYKNAYDLGLLRDSKRKDTTRRAQMEVSLLNRAFSQFFRYAGRKRVNQRFDTNYDYHRDSVNSDATTRLYDKYKDLLHRATTILDVGCGTGKLLRRIVRLPSIMRELESWQKQMRIVGVDMNDQALDAASEKGTILFRRHPKLMGDSTINQPPSLKMELILLDLIDLEQLDLSKTCVGEAKVDLILATDIFRWLRRSEKLNERQRLLHALRKKLKKTGHLISMEFTDPYLPTTDVLLPKSLAMKFGAFSNLHPMTLDNLYSMAEETGFVRVPNSRIPDEKNPKFDFEKSLFPPLVSLVFSIGDD